VRPAPPIIAAIKASLGSLEGELSQESIRRFLEILRETTGLGDVLRQMYDVGVLELIIPDMKHARSLLQFNQYHSYTVDEHTLRTIEAAVGFERDEGPVGAAYRAIHDKETIHLALLLHDLGKGCEEDHSEVGRRIAERTAARLGLPDQQRDALVFLVHKHLKMAHLAFRRNTSDLDVLMPFAQEVGSPEVLRMLYVLTAADLSGVGPGVWNDWKANLLTGLFDNAMLILSGKHGRFQEHERLRSIKKQVWTAMAGNATQAEARELREWLDMQLDAFPPHYLGVTPVAEIAADLEVIRNLGPHEVSVEATLEPERRTVLYRLITHEEYADGVFHKTCGVLTARRMEILSAQISTSLDGFVVDSYRVVDHDYSGEVPPERIEQVAQALRSVLTGATNVQSLFQKHVRFGARRPPAPLSDQQTRVVIDNHSSDRCTIIDVFAHDRTGLLFTISRAIYEMGLSVMLAKISTHLDQIVDVFYVTEQDGRKITDPARLRTIQSDLAAKLDEFEREGYQQFV
jgi:[protein-PII] uridylyltransferase